VHPAIRVVDNLVDGLVGGWMEGEVPAVGAAVGACDVGGDDVGVGGGDQAELLQGAEGVVDGAFG
jgi:hypothetical protein